ncbi:MAG: DUF1972 domain-containing protein [Bacteroidales bacterium]|nr:DUF1972 domain-containing protein [Bacteroidales bacterium]
MKLLIMGTRGIPARYGGFETFAEEISVLLAANGIDVTVQCDFNSSDLTTYQGVNLWHASLTKSENPLKYYLEGFRYGLRNCDVILAASCAASVFYPLNLFKRKVIITNPDGLEYKRKKWPLAKRIYLKVSEMLSMAMSDYIVADSSNIKRYIDSTYAFASAKTRIIEYGAHLNHEVDPECLHKYGVGKSGFYLVVSRLEPENHLEMILDGHKRSGTSYPILIAGNILETEYVKKMMESYASERVIFAGGIYNRNELFTLRHSCKAYIHGHSVGGTNPSLLESMASRNIIIAHDNVFNREVTDDGQFYFSTPEECARRINEVEMLGDSDAERYREKGYRMIVDRYNWNAILTKYLNLLGEVRLD